MKYFVQQRYEGRVSKLRCEKLSKIRVYASSAQGGRKYMEDEYAIVQYKSKRTKDKSKCNYNKQKKGAYYDDAKCGKSSDPTKHDDTNEEGHLLWRSFMFFGIFDGHGGESAAQYTRDNLCRNIVRQREFWCDDNRKICLAIHRGFIRTQRDMLNVVGKWPKTSSGLPSTAGTTASIVFIMNGHYYTGHVGDSRIVLGRRDEAPNRHNGPSGWIAYALTRDHKPESTRERRRIESAGGQVMNKSGVGRVVWNRPRSGPLGPTESYDVIPFLAVARALGDLWSLNGANDRFVVSPEPDVHCVPIDSTDRCLLLATDGLWNMMNNQAAIKVVQDFEHTHRPYRLPTVGELQQSHASQLLDVCMNRWSQSRYRADNTTVLVVLFDSHDYAHMYPASTAANPDELVDLSGNELPESTDSENENADDDQDDEDFDDDADDDAQDDGDDEMDEESEELDSDIEVSHNHEDADDEVQNIPPPPLAQPFSFLPPPAYYLHSLSNTHQHHHVTTSSDNNCQSSGVGDSMQPNQFHFAPDTDDDPKDVLNLIGDTIHSFQFDEDLVQDDNEAVEEEAEDAEAIISSMLTEMLDHIANESTADKTTNMAEYALTTTNRNYWSAAKRRSKACLATISHEHFNELADHQLSSIRFDRHTSTYVATDYMQNNYSIVLSARRSTLGGAFNRRQHTSYPSLWQRQYYHQQQQWYYRRWSPLSSIYSHISSTINPLKIVLHESQNLLESSATCSPTLASSSASTSSTSPSPASCNTNGSLIHCSSSSSSTDSPSSTMLSHPTPIWSDIFAHSHHPNHHHQHHQQTLNVESFDSNSFRQLTSHNNSIATTTTTSNNQHRHVPQVGVKRKYSFDGSIEDDDKSNYDNCDYNNDLDDAHHSSNNLNPHEDHLNDAIEQEGVHPHHYRTQSESNLFTRYQHNYRRRARRHRKHFRAAIASTSGLHYDIDDADEDEQDEHDEHDQQHHIGKLISQSNNRNADSLSRDQDTHLLKSSLSNLLDLTKSSGNINQLIAPTGVNN